MASYLEDEPPSLGCSLLADPWFGPVEGRLPLDEPMWSDIGSKFDDGFPASSLTLDCTPNTVNSVPVSGAVTTVADSVSLASCSSSDSLSSGIGEELSGTEGDSAESNVDALAETVPVRPYLLVPATSAGRSQSVLISQQKPVEVYSVCNGAQKGFKAVCRRSLQIGRSAVPVELGQPNTGTPTPSVQLILQRTPHTITHENGSVPPSPPDSDSGSDNCAVSSAGSNDLSYSVNFSANSSPVSSNRIRVWPSVTASPDRERVASTPYARPGLAQQHISPATSPDIGDGDSNCLWSLGKKFNQRSKIYDLALKLQMISEQKPGMKGPLQLTEEEVTTLEQDRKSVPTRLPLAHQQQQDLKIARRKILNKLSAHESRRKQKEYVESLEREVQAVSYENKNLRRKLSTVEMSNRSLMTELRQLRSSVMGEVKIKRELSCTSTQTSGTCLMVFGLLFALCIPYFTLPSWHLIVTRGYFPSNDSKLGGLLTEPPPAPMSSEKDYDLPERLMSRTLLSIKRSGDTDLSFCDAPLFPDSPVCRLADAEADVRAAYNIIFEEDDEISSVENSESTDGRDLQSDLLPRNHGHASVCLNDTSGYQSQLLLPESYTLLVTK